MRDRRFVAVSRGGPLSPQHHRLLMRWAHDCAEHVLPLLESAGLGERLIAVLDTARAWEHGEVRAGKAREAALEAHAAARAASSPVAVAVARAVGHAAATAHAADHALGAAHYALKAVKAAGLPVELERAWQDERLPPEVRELVLSARQDKRFSRV